MEEEARGGPMPGTHGSHNVALGVYMIIDAKGLFTFQCNYYSKRKAFYFVHSSLLI